VTVRYPTQALLAMAAEMTIPKVAWMLVRGIGRRNAYKIAAVMVLPVVSFLCPVWFDITKAHGAESKVAQMHGGQSREGGPRTGAILRLRTNRALQHCAAAGSPSFSNTAG
jgi:hypothetical protein